MRPDMYFGTYGWLVGEAQEGADEVFLVRVGERGEEVFEVHGSRMLDVGSCA